MLTPIASVPHSQLIVSGFQQKLSIYISWGIVSWSSFLWLEKSSARLVGTKRLQEKPKTHARIWNTRNPKQIWNKLTVKYFFPFHLNRELVPNFVEMREDSSWLLQKAAEANVFQCLWGTFSRKITLVPMLLFFSNRIFCAGYLSKEKKCMQNRGAKWRVTLETSSERLKRYKPWEHRPGKDTFTDRTLCRWDGAQYSTQ